MASSPAEKQLALDPAGGDEAVAAWARRAARLSSEAASTLAASVASLAALAQLSTDEVAALPPPLAPGGVAAARLSLALVSLRAELEAKSAASAAARARAARPARRGVTAR